MVLRRPCNRYQPIFSSFHNQRPWLLGQTCIRTAQGCLTTGLVVAMVDWVLLGEYHRYLLRRPVYPLGHLVARLLTSTLLRLASEGRHQMVRLLVSPRRLDTDHPGRASSSWRLAITGWFQGHQCTLDQAIQHAHVADSAEDAGPPPPIQGRYFPSDLNNNARGRNYAFVPRFKANESMIGY
jgi:hypothetical protein